MLKNAKIYDLALARKIKRDRELLTQRVAHDHDYFALKKVGTQ